MYNNNYYYYYYYYTIKFIRRCFLRGKKSVAGGVLSSCYFSEHHGFVVHSSQYATILLDVTENQDLTVCTLHTHYVAKQNLLLRVMCCSTAKTR